MVIAIIVKRNPPFLNFLSQENICQGGFHPKDEIPHKLELASLYIRHFVALGMNFDGFAINNKYAPHINLTTASATQIIEMGILGNI